MYEETLMHFAHCAKIVKKYPQFVFGAQTVINLSFLWRYIENYFKNKGVGIFSSLVNLDGSASRMIYHLLDSNELLFRSLNDRCVRPKTIFHCEIRGKRSPLP